MKALNSLPGPESVRKIVKSLPYAAIALLVFLMFLIADFPYSDALSTFLAPAGLAVDYQGQHLSLPFGARLDNVRVRYARDPAGSPIVESRTVTLSPTIGSLLFGRPGLRLRADLYDGSIRATVSRSGRTTDLSFALNDVELADFRGLNLGLGGRLTGDGSIELDGAGAQAIDGAGVLQLSGRRLSIRFSPALPPVQLDVASGRFRIDKRTLSIESLEGRGPDFSLSANGTIQLAQSLPESSVDLTIQFVPTASGARRYGPLLGLLPHPPDAHPYILRGPLLFPSIS